MCFLWKDLFLRNVIPFMREMGATFLLKTQEKTYDI